LAQDYATIVDQRGRGDLVMLLWLVPESLPDDQRVARDILSNMWCSALSTQKWMRLERSRSTTLIR
jgi:hypothetical protein